MKSRAMRPTLGWRIGGKGFVIRPDVESVFKT